MNIKTILFATDGSEESNKALDYVVYLAEIFGSRVLALYVSETHSPLTAIIPAFEAMILELAKDAEKRFEKSFDELSILFEKKGIEFSSRIIRNGTVEKIVEVAEIEGADLIVMGKSGHGFIVNALIGSNTCKVIRDTTVPVLAVRKRDNGDRVEIKKILVPIDISDPEISALPEAVSLAGKFQAEIIVIYVFWLDSKVYDIPPGLVNDIIELSRDKLEEIVNNQMNEIIEVNPDQKHNRIKSGVLHGMSPGVTIRRYAKDQSVDLIIIKTHGREGINRLLFGSETENIIRESPCSVLTVK